MFNSKFEKENLSANCITKNLKTECGEMFKFFVTINDNTITEISFTGNVSRRIYASLDLVCQLSINQSIERVLSIKNATFFEYYPSRIEEQYQKSVIQPLYFLQFELSNPK